MTGVEVAHVNVLDHVTNTGQAFGNEPRAAKQPVGIVPIDGCNAASAPEERLLGRIVEREPVAMEMVPKVAYASELLLLLRGRRRTVAGRHERRCRRQAKRALIASTFLPCASKSNEGTSTRTARRTQCSARM